MIVGIGDSTGELEAFKQFFSHVPADSGMAFVLLQPLTPDFSSRLLKLLTQVSDLPVKIAEEGMPVHANHVYVIPPDVTPRLDAGQLKVDNPQPSGHPRGPIDTFFTSLASDCGEKAAGILLAGFGQDGASGLRRIKARGGMTIVQAGRDHAARPGGQGNAESTGMADYVLPIEDMPARLQVYQRHLDKSEAQMGDGHLRSEISGQLQTVVGLLESGLNRHFIQAMQKRLISRVQQRMQGLDIDDAADFVERLRTDEDEVDTLLRELLFGLSQFFRDPATWESLRHNVRHQLTAALKQPATEHGDRSGRVRGANRPRLHASEERLRLACEAAQLGVFEWDAARDTASWENDQMYQIFGGRPEDGPITAAVFMDHVIHREDRPLCRAAVDEALQSGHFHFTGRIFRGDGALRWIDLTGHLAFDEKGQPSRLLGVVIDITEHKRAEEA